MMLNYSIGSESPVKVSQLLSAVLKTIDLEVAVAGPMANGDVLPAFSARLDSVDRAGRGLDRVGGVIGNA